MVGTHRILFQAPAVDSEKVYTAPSLVALFHKANVFVKALTLLIPTWCVKVGAVFCSVEREVEIKG